MMNLVKSQKGYALLVVLLMVVLFLGISATFIAGSLSHAKQEKAVDTSNHAVAAAEMGTMYFTSDFEKELKLIKQDIAGNTQLRLNDLMACIKQVPMGSACDTPTERLNWEKNIDNDMKVLYIDKVIAKVQALNSLSADADPFSTGEIKYSVVSAEATKKNAAKLDVDSASTVDKVVKSIEVELDVLGNSEGVNKELVATFDIKVPDTFLNTSEAIKVPTSVTAPDEDLTYGKIFALNPTSKSCGTLLDEVIAGTAVAPYECASGSNEDLMDFIDDIIEAGLNPSDFRVFTDDFLGYVCDENCNNLDFKGINVIVQEGDADAFNNMNNLINANLIINGSLDAGNNLINLGKNGVKQTIVVKELNVDVNLKNMSYTNFLVLGYDPNPPEKANLDWKTHIEVANYSNLCIDTDRINAGDLTSLSQQITFSNSGKIIYYSSRPEEEYKFELLDVNGQDRKITITNGDNKKEEVKMTDLFVIRESSYSNFLKNCGVVIKNTQTTTTDVSVPYPIDTDFEIDVKY